MIFSILAIEIFKLLKFVILLVFNSMKMEIKTKNYQ